MSKKGLLVVSFGTSHVDARERQILPIRNKLGEYFKDYSVYEAYTSQKIIGILKKAENISMMNLQEAFDQMHRDGITEVIVQPTHVIPGIENDRMLESVEANRRLFSSVVVGNPLLYSTKDYEDVADIVGAFCREQGMSNHQAVVLMGHGSSHYTNTSYCALEYMFRARGYEHIFVATVEAFPDLAQVMKQLKKGDYSSIILLPFMIVAGDHAKNDMAGEAPDSFQSILKSEGYEVTCILKGLGEFDEIQKLFLEHAIQE